MHVGIGQHQHHELEPDGKAIQQCNITRILFQMDALEKIPCKSITVLCSDIWYYWSTHVLLNVRRERQDDHTRSYNNNDWYASTWDMNFCSANLEIVYLFDVSMKSECMRVLHFAADNARILWIKAGTVCKTCSILHRGFHANKCRIVTKPKLCRKHSAKTKNSLISLLEAEVLYLICGNSHCVTR